MSALLRVRALTLAWVAAAASLGACSDKGDFSGAEIVFSVDEGADPDRSIALIRERIDARGLVDVDIAHRDGAIVVRIPGLDDESRELLTEILQRRPALGFHVVAENSAFMQALVAHVTTDDRANELAISREVDAWRYDVAGVMVIDPYLVAADRNEWLTIEEARQRDCSHDAMPEVAGRVECRVIGRAVLDEYLAEVAQEDMRLTPLADRVIRYESLTRGELRLWRTHHLRRAPFLEGRDVAWAELALDADTNQPATKVTLTPAGKAELARVAQSDPGKKIAVVLDGVVNTTFVNEPGFVGDPLYILPAAGPSKQALREVFDVVSAVRAGIPMGITLQSSRTIGDAE